MENPIWYTFCKWQGLALGGDKEPNSVHLCKWQCLIQGGDEEPNPA